MSERPEKVYRDDEEWPEYIIDYRYENRNWSFNVPARSWEDARERLKSICLTGHVEGQLYMKGYLPTPKSIWNIPRNFLIKVGRGVRSIIGLGITLLKS